jgi:hypothetical protein
MEKQKPNCGLVPRVSCVPAYGMADYRELSQQYAQGAIKAALLINAGAAVAVLSQVSKLLEIKSGGIVNYLTCSLIMWASGTVIAVFSWMFAFASTRYVDKSEQEPTLKIGYLQTSDCWMYAAVAAVLLSLLLFISSCIILAIAFQGLVVSPKA